VTEVRHAFVRSEDGCLGYGNAFEAVPEGTPYRPPLRTPNPRVHGVHTAVVTGPAGSPVHTDQWGRVKVQFHWDRHGGMDENSSAWIRVALPAGRLDDPALYRPEVGDDVLVGFEHGDPAQPYVLGALYNGEHPPPVRLP
jgi:type VI secretion system secreted protein VgrG